MNLLFSQYGSVWKSQNRSGENTANHDLSQNSEKSVLHIHIFTVPFFQLIVKLHKDKLIPYELNNNKLKWEIKFYISSPFLSNKIGVNKTVCSWIFFFQVCVFVREFLMVSFLLLSNIVRQSSHSIFLSSIESISRRVFVPFILNGYSKMQ